MVRDIVLALMSSLTKAESVRLGERTRSGLARARAQGKRLGRPPVKPAMRKRVLEALNDRENTKESVRTVAKRLRISPASVQRISVSARPTNGSLALA